MFNERQIRRRVWAGGSIEAGERSEHRFGVWSEQQEELANPYFFAEISSG
jgi:hypothetical protein